MWKLCIPMVITIILLLQPTSASLNQPFIFSAARAMGENTGTIQLLSSSFTLLFTGNIHIFFSFHNTFYSFNSEQISSNNVHIQGKIQLFLDGRLQMQNNYLLPFFFFPFSYVSSFKVLLEQIPKCNS